MTHRFGCVMYVHIAGFQSTRSTWAIVCVMLLPTCTYRGPAQRGLYNVRLTFSRDHAGGRGTSRTQQSRQTADHWCEIERAEIYVPKLFEPYGT